MVFLCVFVFSIDFSEFFIKMVNMQKFQLACAVVFYAVFQVFIILSSWITSFRAYRDPCTFSRHLSGFRGNLSISEVDFVVQRSSGV